MLETGDPAPDFYLPAASDPNAEYMLSAAATAGPVVLAFVPDSSTDARPLLAALADLDWGALSDGISVFGIGRSQAALVDLTEGLPFPLLVDPDGYVTDRYGIADRGSNSGPHRALALADSRCTIRFAWAASAAEESPPLEELTEAIQSL